MKKSISLMLVFALLAGIFSMCGVTAFAEDDILSYLTWEIDSGKVTIVDCDTSISGDVVIPDMIDGYPVAVIGDRAFVSCRNIISITIPEGTIFIGERAFNACPNLENITIPDSVTKIGYNAFYNTAYYNNENNWKNGVLYIGNYLIKAKTDISGTYEIKSGTKAVCDNAFYYCKELENITIPDSVITIGNQAFYNCEKFENVIIPDSIITIGNQAFYNTAYYNNEKNWENGVLYIGSFLIKAKTDISGSYEIKSGTKAVCDEAFEFCKNLENITIPDSVKTIGVSAFEECSRLKNLTITEGITSIGDYAFSVCVSLENLTIPESVKEIGEGAFSGCFKLKSISLPAGLEKIYADAFYCCNWLEEIYIYNPDLIIGEESIGYTQFTFNVRVEIIVAMVLGNISVSLFPDAFVEHDDPIIIENTVIYGYKGSTAEAYASEHGFNFVPLVQEEPEMPVEPETPTEPEDTEDSEESMCFFDKIIAFFNRIIEIIKKLFSFA